MKATKFILSILFLVPMAVNAGHGDRRETNPLYFSASELQPAAQPGTGDSVYSSGGSFEANEEDYSEALNSSEGFNMNIDGHNYFCQPQ